MKDNARKPDDDKLTLQFAALAHPARLRIIRWIGEHECCQCKQVVDALPLAQSTVSQHLKVLLDAGLVRTERRGTASFYRLEGDALRHLQEAMRTFIDNCCKTGGCENVPGNTESEIEIG